MPTQMNNREPFASAVANVRELRKNWDMVRAAIKAAREKDVVQKTSSDEESSDVDESVEEVAERESAEEEVTEDEEVPRLQNAREKHVASSMPLGNQSPHQRQRQSAAEEAFDIDEVVEQIKNNPVFKNGQKATLCKSCESNLGTSVERMFVKLSAMDLEAHRERKENKEFREKMREHTEEMKGHRDEMRKFMVAISKVSGATVQGGNQ